VAQFAKLYGIVIHLIIHNNSHLKVEVCSNKAFKLVTVDLPLLKLHKILHIV